ncbi:snoRNA-binding protein [Saxophila tyrrhenica]|uniref:SnoRNA-binding protein n=1 Tax=Saxophila tyrrhenica TaxID=1690608 RepID=A0AAV9PAT6_9PEZI|nr:snoRNA-binding protein [Saxophila tyrrhenica]
MASVEPEARKERRDKKDKKDKKRKHSETVADADEVEVVAEKKKKKDKKRKSTDGADAEAVMVVDTDGVKDEDDDKKVVAKVEEDDKKVVAKIEDPLAALVPFANPLAGEKDGKKVMKSVKKAAKHKHITRGVKETVKAIRKSPMSTPATLGSDVLPHGIVIIAADISPMDVISHIPVLCEDHNIPYIFVPNRGELGSAGSTKRPTSVVMITEGLRGAKKDAVDKEGEKEFQETYKELHRTAMKLGQTIMV